MHYTLVVVEQDVVLQGELGLRQPLRMADDVRTPVTQRLGGQRFGERGRDNVPRVAGQLQDRRAEIEELTQHDVAAFVDAVAGELGPEGRWFHYGLTSSDVLDTALALQVREACFLLLEGLEKAFTAVVRRAEEHRETVMVGRTHGVHAEPISFGAKLAGWAFELERESDRLERALAGISVGKLAGAVGIYGGGDPEMERVACGLLGLTPEPAATHT